MRRVFRVLLVIFSLSVVVPIGSACAIGADYDGNGFAEIPVISATTSGGLVWNLFDPASGQTSVFTSNLGKLGDSLILANWLYANVTSAGALSRPTSGSGGRLVWTIRTAVVKNGAARIQQHQKFLGRRGEIIITGGDFNGDGFGDALVLTNRGGGSYTWGLRANFFLSSYNSGLSQDRAYFPFGRLGTDKPFFFNPDGRSDWFAILSCPGRSECQVIAKQPFTQATKTIPVGVIADPNRVPVPVAQDDRRDLLAFISESGDQTRIEVKNLKGATIHSFTVPMRGTVTVGNYGPGPGEELSISRDGRFAIINPITGRRSILTGPDGIAADSININSVH